MSIKDLLVIVAALLFLGSTAQAAIKDTPLPVVPNVDLKRYEGKWYEVARLPNKFQKECASDVTAIYTLLNASEIQVVNQCRKANGEIKSAEGKAKLADKNGPNSKLKVRFAPSWLSWLPVVWGDYQIIDLAPDYSYSVVGTPDRKYLWVLSRSPQIKPATYSAIAKRAAELGFDTAKLVKTDHKH